MTMETLGDQIGLIPVGRGKGGQPWGDRQSTPLRVWALNIGNPSKTVHNADA